VGGVRAWRAARQGKAVRPAARAVTVSSLELEEYRPPHATLKIVCSRGTYIRALARDIAQMLGTCAHLAALTRLRIGDFTLPEAVSPDEFNPDRHLLSAAETMERLSGMGTVVAVPGREGHLRCGRALEEDLFLSPPSAGLNAVLDGEGTLVAVVDRRGENMSYVMVSPE
jgi:tRNA pseudouridine55 synthase